jgi:3-deoxy-manno-octulosonate cytidylyltransferase (CMP-KDO synthetase)
MYGYKKESLIKMTQLEQTYLEKQESLEQLRALQSGMKIKVAITDLNPIGIDTIEDYEKFKKVIEG